MLWSWSLAYYASEWAIRVLALWVLPRATRPAAARTWLLLIFLLPWPGLVAYLLIGRVHLPAWRVAMQKRAGEVLAAAEGKAWQQSRRTRPQVKPEFAGAVVLAEQLGHLQTLDGNAVELLPDYDGAIARLIADIDAATHHVHLLYYIFADDPTGNRVADALVRARGRGVDCRLLMDGVASRRSARRLAPRLRGAGVEVTFLLPVGLLRRSTARFDLRNHRKIAVVDGRVGYTGSQNIVGPEFIPGLPNRELVVRVRGPIVAQLDLVFVVDRWFETRNTPDLETLFPAAELAGTSPAQLLPSGPGFARRTTHDLIVSLLHGAQERVVLTTPYFIPDDPFVQALETAVLRGVQVHLIVPERGTSFFVNLAGPSWYEQMLEAGVHIHLYQPRFLHAKHLSFDHSIAMIGSSNLDIRSFALNCEVSLLVYDQQVVDELRAIEADLIAHSRELTLEEWRRRPAWVQALQGIARLADSLL
jgi:cardiolipin synthase